METAITLAFLTAAFFSLFKLIEHKMFHSENTELKALKYFARDILFIFGSVLVASFIMFQMQHTIHDFYNVITDTKIIHPGNTQIFTDVPSF